ncbi:hypothetical protein Leryth_013422 [Lithospermum erythrorhizon]|nr:hypothetical protein Leryth_013422 [Lithospermum erythrorhizon]
MFLSPSPLLSAFRHRHPLILRRRLHSPPPDLPYPLTHPIYTIWASNTSLGKTLVSAGLSISFLISPNQISPNNNNRRKKFVYLKPVQTGFPDDSDSRCVYRKFSEYFLNNRPDLSVFASNYVIKSSVKASEAVLGFGGRSGSDLRGGGVNYRGRKLGGGFGSENGSDSVFDSNPVVKGFVKAPEAVLGFGVGGGSENGSSSGLVSNNVLNASVPADGSGLVFGGGSENGGNLREGVVDLGFYEERKLEGVSGTSGTNAELICKTMYGWKDAVSPHLAVEREGAFVEDYEVLETLKRCLWESSGFGYGEGEVDVMCVVETAGGVTSPGPSGSLQCDLFRPFRMPAVLVGDGKLGGISGTISAYESLKLRGYDIVAVILEEHGLVNQIPLMSYLQGSVPVLVLPPIPRDMSDNLIEWFHESQPVFGSLKEILISAYLERIKRLHELPQRAHDILWWPFTQHKLVPAEKVTVIDSRCGENFAVHKATKLNSIVQQFDACASWWTQGPDSSFQVVSD